jgi:hypothetical protein
VKTVVHSDDDRRFNGISNEVFRILNSVPSSYTVAITVGDKYQPRSQPLRKATDAILKSLEILKEENWTRATLYYSEAGKLLNLWLRPRPQRDLADVDIIWLLDDVGNRPCDRIR